MLLRICNVLNSETFVKSSNIAVFRPRISTQISYSRPPGKYARGEVAAPRICRHDHSVAHAASGVIALRPHRFRTADSDPRLRATTCLQVARRAQRIPPRGRRRRRVTCMRRAAPGELCSRPMVPGERPARAGSKSAPQFSTGAFILACRAGGYRSAALAVPLCLHISPRDARAHFPVLTPSLLYFGRRASPSAGRNVTPLL